MHKSEWIIKVTYNSDNWKKYCELIYHFKGTPKTLEKRIWKHYNEKYEDYGKAEAVVVELITE
jgi:hypothetical protein